MQKPGTDVKKRISSSLVFQLQCIVDSLMVSRGWSISSFRGHVLEPPKSGFRPRRDVDLFLDRENQRSGKGYLQGSDVLKQLLERDSMLHGDPSRHQGQIAVLEGLLWDFRDWLGESKYMYGLNTLPPSRFSNSNANGLWEYSPFLCGVGLAEGLELAYRFGQLLWDQIPEPMLIVHLHNMLVHKKYLDQPIGLFASLGETFRAAFFADGRPLRQTFPRHSAAELTRRVLVWHSANEPSGEGKPPPYTLCWMWPRTVSSVQSPICYYTANLDGTSTVSPMRISAGKPCCSICAQMPNPSDNAPLTRVDPIRSA